MNAFSALADPTRREIIVLLSQKGKLPVSEICKKFLMSSPAISQHLKVLKKANLATMEKQAQQHYYSINEIGLKEVRNWVTNIQDVWTKRLDKLDDYLVKMKREKNNGKK